MTTVAFAMPQVLWQSVALLPVSTQFTAGHPLGCTCDVLKLICVFSVVLQVDVSNDAPQIIAAASSWVICSSAVHPSCVWPITANSDAPQEDVSSEPPHRSDRPRSSEPSSAAN